MLISRRCIRQYSFTFWIKSLILATDSLLTQHNHFHTSHVFYSLIDSVYVSSFFGQFIFGSIMKSRCHWLPDNIDLFCKNIIITSTVLNVRNVKTNIPCQNARKQVQYIMFYFCKYRKKWLTYWKAPSLRNNLRYAHF